MLLLTPERRRAVRLGVRETGRAPVVITSPEGTAGVSVSCTTPHPRPEVCPRCAAAGAF